MTPRGTRAPLELAERFATDHARHLFGSRIPHGWGFVLLVTSLDQHLLHYSMANEHLATVLNSALRSLPANMYPGFDDTHRCVTCGTADELCRISGPSRSILVCRTCKETAK